MDTRVENYRRPVGLGSETGGVYNGRRLVTITIMGRNAIGIRTGEKMESRTVREGVTGLTTVMAIKVPISNGVAGHRTTSNGNRGGGLLSCLESDNDSLNRVGAVRVTKGESYKRFAVGETEIGGVCSNRHVATVTTIGLLGTSIRTGDCTASPSANVGAMIGSTEKEATISS